LGGVVHHLCGVRVYECAADGPAPTSDRDAIDLMSEAGGHGALLVAIPAARLGAGFFDLRTRIAGEFLQKFVTYGMRVAIVGDVPAEHAASTSLLSFIRECNRGNDIWFVSDRAELEQRLAERRV